MSDSDYELDQIAEYVTLRIGYISYAGGHEILARLELNEKIDQAIENITDLSADEICMWLRSTWRVRQYILHYQVVLRYCFPGLEELTKSPPPFPLQFVYP